MCIPHIAPKVYVVFVALGCRRKNITRNITILVFVTVHVVLGQEPKF